MKKFSIFFIVIIFLNIIIFSHFAVIYIMPKIFINNKLPDYCYKKESWYDPSSKQDVTRYEKYYFFENADNDFKENNFYTRVSDTDDVKLYFENFIIIMFHIMILINIFYIALILLYKILAKNIDWHKSVYIFNEYILFFCIIFIFYFFYFIIVIFQYV